MKLNVVANFPQAIEYFFEKTGTRTKNQQIEKKNQTTKQVKWRGDSALDDSSEDGYVALDGGWYDGGDNVKVIKSFIITDNCC